MKHVGDLSRGTQGRGQGSSESAAARLRRPVWLTCAVASVLAWNASGCVNEDYTFHEVEVEARFVVDPTFADAGNVQVQAHLAVSNPGGGDLEHPLGEFERFEVLDGARQISRTFSVPLHRGEGLVIYAWLDVDGDGVLCAPGAAPEPAGLIEVQGFPVFTYEAELRLDQSCKGPEGLYP